MRQRERFLFGKYERARIKLNDGFVLDAGITYPVNFHPGNHYPIWVLTYAGPHAPTVRDGWGSGRIYEQILANMGVVVLRVDPRSASGQGAQSAWACYKQMGVQELKDLEEAVDWITRNPWADASRVGISGHSYGGYISAYALTHSKKFSAAIAGAPVTDWRLYDSIYTERYMGLPSENPEGYRKSSVLESAEKLTGKLLIVHGIIDDNVHAQNSFQLASRLQKANKDFEIMVYPDFRHPIRTTHYPRTQLNFIQRAFGLER
jgi:dipeptidyl-peptidase-4